MILTLLGVTLLASAPPIPPPRCLTANDKTACGYFCRASFNEVACARTPYGICREHFGELKCWDPSDDTIHEYGSDLPRPACLTASTAIGCGYDCKADRSEVKCAQTPRGRCEKHGNEFVCFDPPNLTQCAHTQPPDPEEVRKPKYQRQEEKQRASQKVEP